MYIKDPVRPSYGHDHPHRIFTPHLCTVSQRGHATFNLVLFKENVEEM